MTRGRDGVAVVTVLVLMLAGTALAHGALVIARSELAVARARATTLHRAAALEAAYRSAEVASQAGRLSLDTVAIGGTLVVPDSLWRPAWLRAGGTPWPGEVEDVPDRGGADGAPGTALRFRRLSTEGWWLEAVSGSSRRPGDPARLHTWPDPLERIRAWGAVVVVGPDAAVDLAQSVDVTGWALAVPPLTEDLCNDLGISALGGAAPDRVGTHPTWEDGPVLGPVSFTDLLARTPIRVETAGTVLAREELGRCIEDDPWNWGDPDGVDRPCGPYLAVRGADGSVRIVGGAGQGALVVGGDLVLEREVRFHGLALVRGRLTLHAGAEVHGLVVAAEGVQAEAGAVIRGSACWAARALAAARPSWAPGPVRVPGVPPLGP